jgi:NADH dehydrogenase
MHRVVILGGGFGGLYAAKALRKAPVEVTVVDRRNFHLFQPLLYQVATGSLSPGEIAAPIRAVLSRQKNTRVLLGEAIGLDAARRRLILTDGDVPYDSLIIATGARNFYFGHDDWRKNAPGLKTIEEATEIRQKILFAFEAAERAADDAERNAWLTFAIVGGGATGVELAGALAEIANDTLRNDFRSIRPESARIIVLDSAQRVLPTFPESLSAAAKKSLIHLHVEPRQGVKVTAIDENGVTLDSGEHIAARTVLWGAGVTASEFGQAVHNATGAPLDKHGRVQVSPDLTVPGHPEIFVIGDLAHVEHTQVKHKGSLVPGVAPAAMQEGRYVAKSIEDRLKGRALQPFRYWDKGNLAVIGRASAVIDFGFMKVHGLIAWLLWLFVHLLYLVQFQNRLIVFLRWGIQFFTFDRGARLITGSPNGTRLPHDPEVKETVKQP